jgi:hypothetical protein
MSRRVVLTSVFALWVGSIPSVRAQSYQVVTVANGGTIEGVVKISGAAPATTSITTTKNQDYCGKTIVNPVYTVSGDGGLSNVMVFLKSIDKGKALPAGQIELTNNHCMFEPRVQGASIGQQLKIASLDPILHNTHPQVAATGATLYNVALPFKGFSVVKPLPATPELIQVKCDVHEWMHAWIWVFDHPYYSGTDSAGHFSLTDVPAGTYTLVIWQEAVGQQERSITVSPGKTTTADFSLVPKK